MHPQGRIESRDWLERTIKVKLSPVHRPFIYEPRLVAELGSRRALRLEPRVSTRSVTGPSHRTRALATQERQSSNVPESR